MAEIGNVTGVEMEEMVQIIIDSNVVIIALVVFIVTVAAENPEGN